MLLNIEIYTTKVTVSTIPKNDKKGACDAGCYRIINKKNNSDNNL